MEKINVEFFHSSAVNPSRALSILVGSRDIQHKWETSDRSGNIQNFGHKPNYAQNFENVPLLLDVPPILSPIEKLNILISFMSPLILPSWWTTYWKNFIFNSFIFFTVLLNCQILKRQAQLLKQGWQGFPKRGDGECLSTSWKFAYTPPGEISPAKFFLVLYQKFQHVEYYLSRISISRNIKLKKCEIQFFSHFGKFLKIFLKTYGTLKIFLWSAQNNFTLY